MRLPTKIFLACLLAIHFVLPVRGDAGREESFAGNNCAVTPPAGWQHLDGINQPGCFASFCNADRSRIVLLMVHERGHPAAEFSDASVQAFEQGVTKAGGGDRMSGKFVEMAGYRAYERRGTLSGKGNRMSSLMIAMPTGDGIYLLEALASNGDAGEDAEIRQTLGTFRFLRSPGPPQSAAYRLGYLLGQIGFGAVAVGLVIGLIVWALVRSRSRTPVMPSGPYPYPSGSFPPPPPPPPPPPLPPSPR